MIAQEALFDIKLPPEPPSTVITADPLGPCCKAGCNEPATVASPGGSIYCKYHGKCGGKSVWQSALGIDVRVCGTSVEHFVKHPRMGIWVCPCVGSV